MKKTILSIALIFAISTSFSQSFMNGVGLSFLGTSNSIGGSNDWGTGIGFTYSPRFNFLENDKFSVAVGIPLTVGLSISTSSTYDPYYGNSYSNTSVGFVANVPVVVSFNMGRGSTKSNRQKFGYFVGAGFGYHHGDFVSDIYDPVTNTYTDSYSINTFGPAANAGVRFGVGRKSKNIELRLSYMKGITSKYKPSIFGLACLFNF
ncbi:hypothetical protein BH11BAC4_BH11BAC4_22120 [soil metagenome]